MSLCNQVSCLLQANGVRSDAAAANGVDRTTSLPRTISEDPAGFDDHTVSPKSMITHQVKHLLQYCKVDKALRPKKMVMNVCPGPHQEHC